LIPDRLQMYWELMQAATGTLSGPSRLTALRKLADTSLERSAMAQAGIEIG